MPFTRWTLALGIIALLLPAFSASAASPRRGPERLRELALFPGIQLSIEFGIRFSSVTDTNSNPGPPEEEIARLRDALASDPNDPERLVRLAALLTNTRREAEARELRRKAERLLRAESELRPNDGRVLTLLADVLGALGSKEEALRLCRRATEVAPDDWYCWVDLGKRLDAAFFDLWETGRISGDALMSPESLAAAMAHYRPSAEVLERVETSVAEATDCYQSAIRLEPDRVDVFVANALHCAVGGALETLARSFRNNETPDSKAVAVAFFSNATLTNLQHASTLAPKNYRLIGLIPFIEWCAFVARDLESAPGPGQIPDELHDSFRGALAQLDALSHDANQSIAAGAIETGAVLRFMMSGDWSGSRAPLRRVVALDPSRDQAWEMLMGASVASSDSPSDVVALCEDRLKARDSSRNRLLLAKALSKADKWERAEVEAQIAASRDPNDVAAQLAVVALGIRHSGDPDSLRPIMARLTRLRSLIQNMQPGEDRDERLRELVLNSAIVVGLAGAPEEARRVVEAILANNPDDERAKDILSCLRGFN